MARFLTRRGTMRPTRRAPTRCCVSNQVELSTGGTRPVVTEVSPSYVATYDPSAPYANQDGLVAAPNVDLADEMIQQLMATYAYAANARMVTSYNQMVKSLFDIRA
jgi:flagellar basal-body rod protein FlgC